MNRKVWLAMLLWSLAAYSCAPSHSAPLRCNAIQQQIGYVAPSIKAATFAYHTAAAGYYEVGGAVAHQAQQLQALQDHPDWQEFRLFQAFKAGAASAAHSTGDAAGDGDGAHDGLIPQSMPPAPAANSDEDWPSIEFGGEKFGALGFWKDGKWHPAPGYTGPEPEQPPAAPPKSSSVSDNATNRYAEAIPTIIAKCARCHTGDEPGGGAWLDGSVDLRSPEAADKRDAIMAAVVNGRMPKKSPALTPEEFGAIVAELYRD